MRKRKQSGKPPGRGLSEAGEVPGPDLERVLANMTDGFVIFDREWRCTFANEAAARFVGRSADQMVGRVLWEEVPEAVGTELHAQALAALADGQPRSFENYQPGWDRWFENHLYPSADCVTVVFRDITDRKRVEADLLETTAELRQERELLQLIIDTIPVMITIYDPRLRRFHINREVRQLLGWTTADAEAGDFMALAYPDPEYRAQVTAYMQSLEPGWRDFEVTARDGSKVASTWANIRLSDERQIGIGIDVRGRKQVEEEMRESEQRLRLALDAARLGTWTFSYVEGTMEFGERARELFRAPANRIAHDAAVVASRIHPDDLEETWARIRAAGDPSGDGRYEIEYRILQEDGSIRWAVVIGQTQFTGEGPARRPVRTIGVVGDIDDRKRMEEDLRRAKAAAEAANEAKSQFLAHMSHELRTPMNAILGMTELALDEELSPTVRDMLTTAKDSADTLLDILNDILDLSRVEAGRFHLERTAFGLSELVERTVKTLGLRAFQKGLELVTTIPAEVPDALVGDPTRLRQVLVNLIGNAIKFTHAGGVEVRVGLAPGPFPSGAGRGPADVLLEFSVRDTGIGISEADQARIFAPFTQADISTTRRYGGTGLGLAISRQIVDLMGGELWVDSRPGEGSTFRFTARFDVGLVADESERRPGPAAHEPLALPAPLDRPLRVLVAEDTPAGQKLARFVLEQRGHAVEIAPNGRLALEQVECGRYDAVLMDVQMPEMDGLQATAAIRALDDPRKAKIPIIAMTAHALEGDAERCLEAGMDAYVSKPIDGRELIRLVERLGGAPPVLG